MKKNTFKRAKCLFAALLTSIFLLAGCETTTQTTETDTSASSTTSVSKTTTASSSTSVMSAKSGALSESDRAPAAPAMGTPEKAAPKVAKKAVRTGVYTPSTQLTGFLRSVGSDTMDEMMEQWERDFSKFHPQLRFRHEGRGSSSAIPALLEGRADFGPMSLPVKSSEVQAFMNDRDYAPTQIAVANDTLAVFVHPSNPILNTGLTFKQLEEIFSEGGSITRWGQLGLQGRWENAPIRLHGRNPASGTFGYFQGVVMSGRDYSGDLVQHAGSAGIIDSIGSDPYAIGYSGIAYGDEGVRPSPLSASAGKAPVLPTKETAGDQSYPLTRSLYVTVSLDPSSTPSELQSEFMRFIVSDQGQRIVSQIGYFPLSDSAIKDVVKRFEK